MAGHVVVVFYNMKPTLLGQPYRSPINRHDPFHIRTAFFLFRRRPILKPISYHTRCAWSVPEKENVRGAQALLPAQRPASPAPRSAENLEIAVPSKVRTRGSAAGGCHGYGGAPLAIVLRMLRYSNPREDPTASEDTRRSFAIKPRSSDGMARTSSTADKQPRPLIIG